MGQWIAMFDGQIDLFRSPPPLDGPDAGLDAQTLTAVPAKRGILALLADADTPLILLPAADMRSRLSNRLATAEPDKSTKSADLRSVARKALWKLSFSHFATDLDYLEIARAIWPKTYHTLLSWKPPWFVHADAAEAYPRLVRTREVLSRPGKYFGPFFAARSADAFIDALQDAFELCRDYRCLRQAPNAQPCAYAQMGRCLSPCDGSISMDQYRGMVAAAADFAAGRRVDHRQQLRGRMKHAAGELQFEHAAAIKTRLARLDELDSGALALVRPVEQFRFIIVQNGGRFNRAEVFLADAGRVVRAGIVDFPPDGRQLSAVVQRMAQICASPGDVGRIERLRMGLVSRYFFSGDERRGLMLRWHESMAWEQLATAIEDAASLLRLRCGKKKTPKADSDAGL